MITFVKTNFNYDISEYITKNVNKKSKLITSKKSVNYFKRLMINKKLNNTIDVIDFNSLIMEIYKSSFKTIKILDNNKQKLYFIKAFNNVETDLNLLKGYDTSVIDYIIDIYNKEWQFLLKRTTYKTDLLEEVYLVINEYLRLINGIYEDFRTLYNKVLLSLPEKNFDKTYIFDNISDFNDIEINIIKELGKNNDVIIFTYNNDLLKSNQVLFNYYNYLKDTNIEDIIINNDISLEKQAILNKNSYLDIPKDISLFEAKDLYDEVLFLNNQIMKLIKENKAKLNDFTIVVNNLDDYENYFDLIFKNQVFYNKKETIDHKFFEKVKELVLNLNKNLDENSIKELYEIVLNNFKNNNYDFENNYNTWNSFIGFIDSFIEVFNNSSIDLKHFINIFDAYFENITILKQYTNEIKVISLKDAFSIKTKYTFFIGVLEGIVPSGLKSNILINNPDLFYNNYPLFYDVIKENFNILFVLAQPNLYISYPKTNIDNKKINPSNIIKNIKDIYPKLKLNTNDIILYSYSNKNTFNNYKTMIDLNKISKLNDYFTNKDKYNKYIDFDKKINNFYNPKHLNKDIYDKVINNNLYLSASKIDTYVKCPFKYFLENILKLNPEIDEIYDSRIVGTFVHGLLERLINNIDSDSFELMNKYIVDFVNDHALFKDPIYKYFINVLGKNTLYIWKSIKSELLNSKYKPLYTELNINKSDSIKKLKYKVDNVDVFMTGIIDRIDKYNNFIRIIDYKTGDKRIDFNDFINGLNMQLFIYMRVMKEQEGNMVSGIFYMPAFAKFDDTENYKLKGIFFNNEDNINALGGENINEYIDAYSRGKLNSNILFDKNKYEKLNDFTDQKIEEIAHNVISGNIDIKPIKSTNICKYCKFKAICGTEDKTRNNHKIAKLSNEEIKNLLGGDFDGKMDS